jgi:hypothetical protein
MTFTKRFTMNAKVQMAWSIVRNSFADGVGDIEAYNNTSSFFPPTVQSKPAGASPYRENLGPDIKRPV